MKERLLDYELWCRQKWATKNVVGEHYHEPEIRSLFPARFGDGGRELTLRAALIPERKNRADPNAVKIVAGGQHVGYLSKDDARNYQQVLMRLLDEGKQAVTDCRIYAWEREEWLGTDRRGRQLTRQVLQADVTLMLDEWWMCVPLNTPPEAAHTLLPMGTPIQVRKEENHQDVLQPFLCPQGEAWVYLTLGVIADQSARVPKELVEIRIEDQRVGELTPAMSAEYIPIIRQIEQLDRVTAAKGVVKGNTIKADVVLYAAKASQLEAQWIAAHASAPETGDRSPSLKRNPDADPQPGRDHEPIPPKPSRICFNVPPGWPPPPEGWEPHPGWHPAPDWPPAPSSWIYWVAKD